MARRMSLKKMKDFDDELDARHEALLGRVANVTVATSKGGRRASLQEGPSERPRFPALVDSEDSEDSAKSDGEAKPAARRMAGLIKSNLGKIKQEAADTNDSQDEGEEKKTKKGGGPPKKSEKFLDALNNMVKKNPHLAPLATQKGNKSVIARAARHSFTEGSSPETSQSSSPVLREVKKSHWTMARSALANDSAGGPKKLAPLEKRDIHKEKEQALANRRRLSAMYTPKVDKGCLKLEKKLVSLKEIQGLRDYFDDIDDNGNGVVTLDEIMLHRIRGKRKDDEMGVGEEDHTDGVVMTLLRQMVEEGGNVTFEAMMHRAYPDATQQEIKACCAAVKVRSTAPPEVEEVEVDTRKYTKFLTEVAEYWKLYARITPRKPEGLMSLAEFTGFMNLFEVDPTEDHDEDARKEYESLTYKGKEFVYRDEFTVWWMNYFRTEEDGPKITWEDIKEEAEEFWARLKEEEARGSDEDEPELPEVHKPANSLMDPKSNRARDVGRDHKRIIPAGRAGANDSIV